MTAEILKRLITLLAFLTICWTCKAQAPLSDGARQQDWIGKLGIGLFESGILTESGGERFRNFGADPKSFEPLFTLTPFPLPEKLAHSHDVLSYLAASFYEEQAWRKARNRSFEWRVKTSNPKGLKWKEVRDVKSNETYNPQLGNAMSTLGKTRSHLAKLLIETGLIDTLIYKECQAAISKGHCPDEAHLLDFAAKRSYFYENQVQLKEQEAQRMTAFLRDGLLSRSEYDLLDSTASAPSIQKDWEMLAASEEAIFWDLSDHKGSTIQMYRHLTQEIADTYFADRALQNLQVRAEFIKSSPHTKEYLLEISFMDQEMSYAQAFSHGYKSRRSKMSKSPVSHFFYLFNKLLSDIESDIESDKRLFLIQIPDAYGRVSRDHFGLILLSPQQANSYTLGRQSLLKKHQELLGPRQVRNALTQLDRAGLLNLSEPERGRLMDQLRPLEISSEAQILSFAPDRVVNLSLSQIQGRKAYKKLLIQLAKVSAGKFQPHNIEDDFSEDSFKRRESRLTYDLAGKKFTRKLLLRNRYYPVDFIKMFRNSCTEAGLGGNFYLIRQGANYELSFIWINDEQLDTVKKHLGEKFLLRLPG